VTVYVIGLGRQRPASEFADMLDGAAVVARNSAVAAAWLGSGRSVNAALDNLFDTLPPSEICDAIVLRIETAVRAYERCLYLVPESGAIGDSTVAAVLSRLDARLIPGAFEAVEGFGALQIVDALELALAEERAPFDAGLAAIDQARPLLISNAVGQSVAPLAEQRLTRLYGSAEFQRAPSGTMFIQGLAQPAVSASFAGLERIVAHLRSPEGCPWDREQTFESLMPMMLEELDELREALEAGSADEQADELGDVLLHIVMIAQIAREAGRFGAEDVLRAISAKMIRRHPHVFGDVEISSIEDLYAIWREVKDGERAAKMEAQAALREG
jgi:NTP pyrophosphatase (non-canonical NTP hydrolase)